MIVIFCSVAGAQNKLGYDICYNSYISKAEYHHKLGESDSSLLYLNVAQKYNVLIPQHYLTAVKIYITNEEYAKTYPLLRILIKYGYKIESLFNESEVVTFLSDKEEFKQSLLSDYANNINRLSNHPMCIIINDLFELDQKNREDRIAGIKLLAFIETEKYIQRILVDSLIGTTGIPVLTEIGFVAHGELFAVLLHQATNEKYFGVNIMDEITRSFIERNFSNLEYGAILDRNMSHELGYSRYGILGNMVNGAFTLGANIQNIEKIDSLRHYDLGLPPLKYQAYIQNVEIVSDYKFKEYHCTDPFPDIKSREIRDTIPLIRN